MKKIKILTFTLIFIAIFYPISLANDTLVYVDSNNIDTKYHRLTCDFIPKNYRAISVETAFTEGFRKCSVCNPTISDTEKKLKDEEYQERLNRAKEISNSVVVSNYTANTNSNDEEAVYVTSNGSKYHLKDCISLKNSSQVHKVMLRTAISKGYIPCKTCNPYELADTFYQEDGNNVVEESNFANVLTFVLNLILTIALYMGVPFYLRYKKVKFNSKSELLQLVIGYSIAIYALYFIIYISQGNPHLPNIIPPFFYGIINYKMLKKFNVSYTNNLNNK